MSYLFHNWSSTDFTYNWSGKPYNFAAGEVYSDVVLSVGGERLLLEPGIIDHFARHLADREMNEQKISPGRLDVWEDFVGRAKVATKESAVNDSRVVSSESVITEEVIEKPKKRMGRPPKAKEVEPEAEFEGIE